jgi:hypothetical protein
MTLVVRLSTFHPISSGNGPARARRYSAISFCRTNSGVRFDAAVKRTSGKLAFLAAVAFTSSAVLDGVATCASSMRHYAFAAISVPMWARVGQR